MLLLEKKHGSKAEKDIQYTSTVASLSALINLGQINTVASLDVEESVITFDLG